MRLEILQTFDQSFVKTKDDNLKRQKDKKKDKRQRPKIEFSIVTSGQFRTLAMF